MATADTAARPKRVLESPEAAVVIRALKTATPVGPQIQPVDGAPGSTPTPRGDRTTMYVESPKGASPNRA